MIPTIKPASNASRKTMTIVASTVLSMSDGRRGFAGLSGASFLIDDLEVGHVRGDVAGGVLHLRGEVVVGDDRRDGDSQPGDGGDHRLGNAGGDDARVGDAPFQRAESAQDARDGAEDAQ